MTAKQALREYIDQLSEDDARDLLHRIHGEDQGPHIPLTEEQMASIRRALADSAAGRVHATTDVLQHLGLNA